MKEEKGRFFETAEARLVTDDGVVSAPSFDFAATGRKAGPAELEAMAKAASACGADEDSLFFAYAEFANEIGADLPEWGLGKNEEGDEDDEGKSWRDDRRFSRTTGLALLTGEDAAGDGGATVIANLSTRRIAILTKDDDGLREGYVVAPGDHAVVAGRRVLSREPDVKETREDGARSVPIPYSYVEREKEDGGVVWATGFVMARVKTPPVGELGAPDVIGRRRDRAGNLYESPDFAGTFEEDLEKADYLAFTRRFTKTSAAEAEEKTRLDWEGLTMADGYAYVAAGDDRSREWALPFL